MLVWGMTQYRYCPIRGLRLWASEYHTASVPVHTQRPCAFTVFSRSQGGGYDTVHTPTVRGPTPAHPRRLTSLCPCPLPPSPLPLPPPPGPTHTPRSSSRPPSSLPPVPHPRPHPSPPSLDPSPPTPLPLSPSSWTPTSRTRSNRQGLLCLLYVILHHVVNDLTDAIKGWGPLVAYCPRAQEQACARADANAHAVACAGEHLPCPFRAAPHYVSTFPLATCPSRPPYPPLPPRLRPRLPPHPRLPMCPKALYATTTSISPRPWQLREGSST